MSFSPQKLLLINLEISGKEIRDVSSLISQSFLIKSVNLGSTQVSIPPSYFLGLPLILTNPKQLLYIKWGNDNSNIIGKMIDLTYYEPDCEILLKKPNSKQEIRNFPAYTSFLEIFKSVYPHLSIDTSNYLFCRTFKNQTKLLLPICNLPISVFHIPGSVWTIEFRNFPSSLVLCPDTLLLTKKWISSRINETNPLLSEVNQLIVGFNEILNNESVTSSQQEQFNSFLKTVINNRKYNDLLIRVYKSEENEFRLNPDRSVTIIHSSLQNPLTIPGSKLRLSFENDSYNIKMNNSDDISIPIRMDSVLPLLELFNCCYFDFYASIPPRDFSFDFPPRGTLKIPRACRDSRVMMIKDEMIDTVYRQEMDFGNELLKKKQTNKA